MEAEVLIYCDDGIFDITENIIEKINLNMYYQETPSTFEVKFLNRKLIDVNEGDAISFKIDNEKIFFGYIFTIHIEDNHIYTIKAYDQIRYLIAKDTYIYSNKMASQIISMICDDFNLKKGTIENTGYVIPSRIEENQAILDIMYTALELTKNMNGKQYVLFDDFGKICLKSYESMKTGIIFNLDNGITSYRIEKSIDSDVYNSVKVTTKDRKTKVITSYQKDDPETKKKWGTLRYFQRLDNTYTKAQAENYASNILNLKNRNKFKITLETIGEVAIRGGSIVTILNGEQKKEMLVEKCTHTICNNEHMMKLILVDF